MLSDFNDSIRADRSDDGGMVDYAIGLEVIYNNVTDPGSHDRAILPVSHLLLCGQPTTRQVVCELLSESSRRSDFVVG